MSNDGSLDCTTSGNAHFQSILERSLHNPARLSLLRGGVGVFALASVPLMSACGGSDTTDSSGVTEQPRSLGFTATEKSLLDSVVLPAGYTFSVLHATGDRLTSSIPAYANKGTETDDWSMRVGGRATWAMASQVAPGRPLWSSAAPTAARLAQLSSA